MSLTCRSCHAPIADEDVNWDRLIGKCRQCHAVMRVPALPTSEEDSTDEPVSDEPSTPAPPPRGYRVENTETGLVIVKRWMGCFFAIAIFLVLVVGVILLNVAAADFAEPLLKTGILCFLGVMEFFLVYVSMAVLLNRTVIAVDKERLAVRHGPVPWPGNCTMGTEQIRGLACREYKSSDTGTSYAVYVTTSSGDRKRLTGALTTRAEGNFVVDQVERFLRLEERAEELEAADSKSYKEGVPPPSGFRVEEPGDQLRIVWRWRTGGTIMHALFFCAFWGGVWWFVSSNFAFAATVRTYTWILVAVGALTIWGLYVMLGRLVNSTVIRVDAERLSIRHGPMPWAGKRTLPVAQLKQLYCEMKRQREKEAEARPTWDLNAVTTDGAQVKLLVGLTERNQGLFIEQQVERYLRIKDEPVGGEGGA